MEHLNSNFDLENDEIISNQDADVDILKKEILNKNSKISNLTENLKDYQNKLHTKNHEIHELKSKLIYISKANDKILDQCNSEICNGELENILNEVEIKNKKISNFIKEKFTECENLKGKLEKLERIILSKNKEIDDFELKSKNYEEKIFELNEQIIRLNEEFMKMNEAHEKVKEIYLNDLKMSFDQNNNLTKIVEDLKYENKEMEAKIQVYEKISKNKNKIKKEHKEESLIKEKTKSDENHLISSSSKSNLLSENLALKEKIRILTTRLQIAMKSYESLQQNNIESIPNETKNPKKLIIPTNLSQNPSINLKETKEVFDAISPDKNIEMQQKFNENLTNSLILMENEEKSFKKDIFKNNKEKFEKFFSLTPIGANTNYQSFTKINNYNQNE